MKITHVTTRALRTPADNPLVVGLPAPTDTREFVTLELCRDVLAVFIRVLFGWLRRRAASRGIRDSQCGAVTVIQRNLLQFPLGPTLLQNDVSSVARGLSENFAIPVWSSLPRSETRCHVGIYEGGTMYAGPLGIRYTRTRPASHAGGGWTLKNDLVQHPDDGH